MPFDGITSNAMLWFYIALGTFILVLLGTCSAFLYFLFLSRRLPAATRYRRLLQILPELEGQIQRAEMKKKEVGGEIGKAEEKQQAKRGGIGGLEERQRAHIN